MGPICLEHLGSLYFRGGEERSVSTKVVNLLLTLLNRNPLVVRVPAMSFTKQTLHVVSAT